MGEYLWSKKRHIHWDRLAQVFYISLSICAFFAAMYFIGYGISQAVDFGLIGVAFYIFRFIAGFLAMIIAALVILLIIWLFERLLRLIDWITERD